MHQWLTPPSYAVPSHYRFSKFSRKEAPDGRGRTFVPDDISIRIRPITRRPLLFPSSQTRSPVGSPRGSLSATRTNWAPETYGVSKFRINTTVSNLGSARPPVAQHLRRRTLSPSSLATYLLVRACQHLWLSASYGSAAVHMIINLIALSWLPTALMLAELSLPHGSLSKNRSSSGFVARRFIPIGAVPRDAWPCWIPVVEHRVVY